MLGGTRSCSAVVTLLDEQGAPVQPRPDLSDPDQRPSMRWWQGWERQVGPHRGGCGRRAVPGGIRGWRGTGPAWNLVAVVRDKDVAGRFASDVRVILAGVVLLVLLAISGTWAFLRKRRMRGSGASNSSEPEPGTQAGQGARRTRGAGPGGTTG